MIWWTPQRPNRYEIEWATKWQQSNNLQVNEVAIMKCISARLSVATIFLSFFFDAKQFNLITLLWLLYSAMQNYPHGAFRALDSSGITFISIISPKWWRIRSVSLHFMQLFCALIAVTSNIYWTFNFDMFSKYSNTFFRWYLPDNDKRTFTLIDFTLR